MIQSEKFTPEGAEDFVAPITGSPDNTLPTHSRISPGELINEGAEKQIFTDENNPEKLIAIYKEYKEEAPEETKSKYYMGKLLHLLEPNHFPDIHYADNKTNAQVIESIHSDQDKPEYASKEDAEQLRRQIKSRYGFFLDPGRKNYLYRDGKTVAVDIQPPFGSYTRDGQNYLDKNFDESKILASLENLPDDQKEIGLNYLSRLRQLQAEFINRNNLNRPPES